MIRASLGGQDGDVATGKRDRIMLIITIVVLPVFAAIAGEHKRFTVGVPRRVVVLEVSLCELSRGATFGWN